MIEVPRQSMDSAILAQVRCKLRSNRPKQLDGQKKASVALLLRPAGTDAEVFYIKRAARKGDRWSGDVAFPGGKQEPGECELDTAIREVREEVGLDLAQSDVWECLGHLDDRKAMELTVRCFVFLQLQQATPPLRLQESEVASCGWCSLQFLCEPSGEIQQIDHLPLSRFNKSCPTSSIRRIGLAGLLGLNAVCFNYIDLPIESVQPQTSTQFKLWGLTLGMTNDFLVGLSLRRVDNPFTVYPCLHILGIRFEKCLCKGVGQSLILTLLLRVVPESHRQSPVKGFFLLLYVEVFAIIALCLAISCHNLLR